MKNFSYLFGCDETKEAAVVDPAFDQEIILEQARSEGLKITYIFTTHSHHDHVGGHQTMLDKTGAKVVAHQLAADEIRKIDIPVEIVVEDQDEVHVGKIMVKIIHTPGHTKGGICLLVHGAKLITGDTLFVGDCGRTDLPGGSSKELFESIHGKLMRLDDAVEVYPGHDYGDRPFSTIGQEKKNNPAMTCKNYNELETLP